MTCTIQNEVIIDYRDGFADEEEALFAEREKKVWLRFLKSLSEDVFFNGFLMSLENVVDDRYLFSPNHRCLSRCPYFSSALHSGNRLSFQNQNGELLFTFSSPEKKTKGILRAWAESVSEKEKEEMTKYLAGDGKDIASDIGFSSRDVILSEMDSMTVPMGKSFFQKLRDPIGSLARSMGNEWFRGFFEEEVEREFFVASMDEEENRELRGREIRNRELFFLQRSQLFG